MFLKLVMGREGGESESLPRTEEKRSSHEQNQAIHLEHTSEENLRAKKVMAEELITMGLSEEAIERILHMGIGPKGGNRRA